MTLPEHLRDLWDSPRTLPYGAPQPLAAFPCIGGPSDRWTREGAQPRIARLRDPLSSLGLSGDFVPQNFSVPENFFVYCCQKNRKTDMNKSDEEISLSLPERHSRILSLLQQSGSISVTQLAERFRVSEVTIRKDLSYLEQQKKLYRTHGSAILISPLHQRPACKREGRRRMSSRNRQSV